MSIDTHSGKPGPYQDIGARANLSDRAVSAIAVGLGVTMVALIAVLMGLA